MDTNKVTTSPVCPHADCAHPQNVHYHMEGCSVGGCTCTEHEFARNGR